MNQILYSGKTKKNIEFNIDFKTIAIIFLIVLIVLIFLLSTIFAFINRNNTNIISYVSVSGVDLSGLSREEALNTLKENLTSASIPDSIDVTVDGNIYSLDSSKLVLSYDYDATVEKAYQVGRNSNFIFNNYTIISASLFGVKVFPVCYLEEESFSELIDELNSYLDIENPATDTSYEISDDMLHITKGTDGEAIDKDLLKDNIISAFIKNDYSSISTSIINKKADEIDIDKLYAQIHQDPVNAQKIDKDGIIVFEKAKDGITFDVDAAKELVANSNTNTLEIPLIKTQPEITNEMVMADMFNDNLATYTTGFDVSNTNRAENIKLAVEKINGTILLPEDEFSFNNTVGDRTELAGFKLANIYTDGKLEEEIGGGVSQVSSTLYNAAILSNLQIVERKNHTYTVSFVPLGQDSNVSYGIIDLKLKNNRVTPIKIEATVNNDIIKINILGTKSVEDYDVKIESITTQTNEFVVRETEVDTLEKGKTEITQNGTNGCTIETYKILYKDGVENNKQLISTSIYMSIEQLVNVGTKEPAKTTTTTKKSSSTKKNNTTKKNNGSSTIPTTPVTPSVPETPYTPPTLPPGWDVPENPYR